MLCTYDIQNLVLESFELSNYSSCFDIQDADDMVVADSGEKSTVSVQTNG